MGMQRELRFILGVGVWMIALNMTVRDSLRRGSMLTNRAGIHPALFRAIQKADEWYGGSGEERFASVTQLLKPTGMAVLEKLYGDRVVEEAADKMWTLMGSAMHKVIELGHDESDDSLVCEPRFSMDILGLKVTGGADLVTRVSDWHRISDFKFTSVWSFIYGDREPEWTAQLNMYKLMSGLNVEELEIVLIFRDWSANKAKTDKSYPQHQTEVVPIEPWDNDRIRMFMEDRVRALSSSLAIKDDNKREYCSPSERWQTPTKYAVMKPGRKSALRLCDSEKEAQTWMLNNKSKGGKEIVKREGQRKRCLGYCSVANFCPSWKACAGG